ncbi:MAG: phasin family protein [Hyphomicrobiaceae bacterium]
MMKSFEDMQKFSQGNMDATMKAFGDWTKGWQAIAAEWSDYSKRSFEDGSQTFEKLLGARSVEQAVEIQSGYTKRAYEDYMHQIQKVGGMYTEFAREAYRPVERMMQGGR